MQLQRVTIDADPAQVYRLVRAHLRGTLHAGGDAKRADLRAADNGTGLGDLARPETMHRRVVSMSTARRGRPTAGGVYFTEWFANRYIERFWDANTLAAGELFEQTGIVLDDVPPNDYRGVIGTDVQPMGTFPLNHLLTTSEQYADVNVRALLWGDEIDAFAFARASGNGTSVLSGYAIRHNGASRDTQLLRIDAGVPTVIAAGSDAPGLVKDLRLQVNGTTISGGVGSLALSTTDATYTSGRIGFGQNFSPREWYCYRFIASEP